MGDFRVVQLIRCQHGTGAEVVTQAQRVAHFVHDHFFDGLTNQLFRQGWSGLFFFILLGLVLLRFVLLDRISKSQGRQSHFIANPSRQITG